MATSGEKLVMVVGGLVVIGGLSFFSRNAAAAEVKRVNVKPNVLGAKGVLPLVVKWAKVFGAPPSLVMAIIENESRFNANATNLTSPGDVKRGGAWGLAQITLQTAKGLYAAAKSKLPAWDGTGEGLLDPNLNVAMACYGIAANWRRYQSKPNNWLAAGLAWNTGAGAVDKHVTTDPPWILNHPYAQHIAGYRTANPVTAELFAQEQSRGDFAYA